MRAFRLIDGTENELIFGVDNSINNATLDKLKKGLARIKPFEQVVPYYKNSKFAFMFYLFHPKATLMALIDCN